MDPIFITIIVAILVATAVGHIAPAGSALQHWIGYALATGYAFLGFVAILDLL